MVAGIVETCARRRVARCVYYEVRAIEARVGDSEIGRRADEEDKYEEACEAPWTHGCHDSEEG